MRRWVQVGFLLVAAAGLSILAEIAGSEIAAAAPPLAAQTEPDIWPNAASRANSDPWLVANHDRIRQMRPRLLVLNLVNGLKPEAARQKVDALIAALRESSRYHGYADPQAPVFLDYQVEKLVD